MRKFFVGAMLALGVLCADAYNVDYDVIELDKNYINKDMAYIKEKAVEIFNKEYIVFVRNVKLNHTWFTAEIVIEDAWSELSYSVEQYCEYEDPTPDVHGNQSVIETSMIQNTDFMIKSIVHLKAHDYGETEVVYTIRDNANFSNTFDLVLRFPYRDETVTSIEAVGSADMQPVEYYDLQGRKLNVPTSGVVIEKRGNEVSKKLYR